MFAPLMGYEAGLEAALADCQARIHKGIDWTDPATLEACTAYWQVGIDHYDDFVTRYGSYFEVALAANPYAPSYAFNEACLNAELPIEEWVAHFDFSALGYLEVAEDDAL